MKRIGWLGIGIILLSACSFSGLENVREVISFISDTPTPTATLRPTATRTPTPLPTPTPVPHLFEVGQSVYLRPDLTEAVFGPFKLERSILYMKVSELQCEDYQTYQQSETWVYHGQSGIVQDLLICGEEVYYHLALETWSHSDVEAMWVNEDQLAGDYPVLGYPFIVSYPDDSLEVAVLSPYAAYLPSIVVLGRGRAGQTTVDGVPVQIELDHVQEVDHNKSRFYRYLSTGIRVQNDGEEQLISWSKDLIQARANGVDIISNPTVKLTQINPQEISLLPGESIELDLVWKFTRTRYSNHDLAIYISIKSPLEDNLYTYITEDSLFFRDLLSFQN